MKSAFAFAVSAAVSLSASAQTVPPGYSWSVFKSGITLADGVVLHPNGNVYVNDESAAPLGGIWRILPDGTTDLFVTGMNRADGLAIDWRTGDLMCSEESTGGDVWRVNVDDGTRTIEVDAALSNHTEGIAFDETGTILYLVEDRTPGRVQAWDGSSVSLVAGGLNRPEGVTVDIDGSLIVAETATNRVLRIDPGTGVATDLIPPGTAIMPDNVLYDPFTGEIFVGEDQFPGRIFRVAPDGSWSVFASGLASPQGMFFAPDGRLFVSEQSRNRVLVITGFLPRMIAPATTPVGTSVSLTLDAGPSAAGLHYRILLSANGSHPGIRLDSRVAGDRRRLPMNPDPVRFSRTFPGSRGRLDASGLATAITGVPNRPSLAGRSFQAAGVVLSSGIVSISGAPTIRIE
jgi:sugar lactone lactonase YvrE